MKNLFNSIRFKLLALLVITTLASCEKDKKDPEPAPDVATKVSGKYVFSEMNYKGKDIPADETNLKGDIVITRSTESTVDVELNIRSKNTNEDFMVYTVEDVNLTESNGNIDLYYEGEQVAQIKNKKLIISGVDEVGERFSISAVK